MAVEFRVELNSYRGIESKPDAEAGRKEIEEYLSHNYPVFVAALNGEKAGYMVCRINDGIVWVESLYVKNKYRRQGIAAALHGKAEEIASAYGEETVYNYVHPNNHRIIEFLRKHGYTVLNLLEIRRSYRNEKHSRTINVGEHEFDY